MWKEGQLTRKEKIKSGKKKRCQKVQGKPWLTKPNEIYKNVSLRRCLESDENKDGSDLLFDADGIMLIEGKEKAESFNSYFASTFAIKANNLHIEKKRNT